MSANDEMQLPQMEAVEVQHLRRALESRTTISAAVGMLMERYDLTYESGFAHLARLSQERNVKLRDVAGDIVGGDLTGPPAQHP